MLTGKGLQLNWFNTFNGFRKFRVGVRKLKEDGWKLCVGPAPAARIGQNIPPTRLNMSWASCAFSFVAWGLQFYGSEFKILVRLRQKDGWIENSPWSGIEKGVLLYQVEVTGTGSVSSRAESSSLIYFRREVYKTMNRRMIECFVNLIRNYFPWPLNPIN